MLASLLLAACASVPAPISSDRLLSDSSFAAPSQRISGNDVFAVSPEMKHYLATAIAADVKGKGAQQGLFDALYSKNQLQLEYESTMTRNAAQAFAARSGNCLSLVIMTAAFAKEMGLTVTYQQGYVDETWSRAGDLYMSIGHVNLTLGLRYSEIGAHYYDGDKLTIDFLPPADIRGLHTRVVHEQTIIAMYMNNRAVESMAVGQLDDAYWWVREAIAQDPKFMSAYNTLGAIYEKHGNFAKAEQVLSYALASEPKNTHVMSNLVPVLKALGRDAEANELARKLAQTRTRSALFASSNRGIVAMRAGQYAAGEGLVRQGSRPGPVLPRIPFLACCRVRRAWRVRPRTKAHVYRDGKRPDARRP